MLTFRDTTFRGFHSLNGHSESAAHPHWHTYTVRFWFRGGIDQDELATRLEKLTAPLHGSNLNDHFEDSSDEGLCRALYEQSGALRVRVTNDYQRGAEIE